MAYRGIPLQPAYSGAKFAIWAFLDAVRSELIHDSSPVRISIVQLPALNTPQYFVATKVMAWMTLDRALKVADRTGADGDLERWRQTKDQIHAEVMERGWSERLNAFRQRYDAEVFDASVLLIPVMGFLKPDHPRVGATLERIAQALTLDGLAYRFDPRELPKPAGTPLGEREAAFLPATFWLAAAYASLGETTKAEAILKRVEAAAGELGLFAEGLNPRDGTFRGNTPLVFSHAEYLKAVVQLAKARPLGIAGLATSQAMHHVQSW